MGRLVHIKGMPTSSSFRFFTLRIRLGKVKHESDEPPLFSGRGSGWRYLLYWLNERWPIILVLYDTQEDRAFWLYMQDYFRRQRWAKPAEAISTVVVRIPAANVLDEAAIRLFAQFWSRRPGRR